MSSYIVNDHTINRIIAGLEQCKNYGDFINYPRLTDDLCNQMSEGTPAEFGKKMYLLNVASVEANYSEDLTDQKDLYQFRPATVDTPKQLYKSLHCFLYQCDNGEEADSLFRALDEFRSHLARWLVEQSHEYDGLEWG